MHFISMSLDAVGFVILEFIVQLLQLHLGALVPEHGANQNGSDKSIQIHTHKK